MIDIGLVIRKRVPCLLAVLVLLSGCSSTPATTTKELVVAETTTPPTAFVADYIPPRFVLHGVSAGSATAYQAPIGLLLGDLAETDVLSGPVALVGSSFGSAAIAGPAYGEVGTAVEGLDTTMDGMPPSIVRDGRWNWLRWNDGCGSDCSYYVVGRGVTDENLIAIAKGASFDDDIPVVDKAAIPRGLTPIVRGVGGDNIGAPAASRLTYRSPQHSQLSVEVVKADSLLASLWAFWIDSSKQVKIGQYDAFAGTTGLVLGGAGREAVVWAQQGLVVAVSGDVSAAEIRKVAASVRPAKPGELDALDKARLDRPPTASEAGCSGPAGVVLSERVAAGRWAVCFDVDKGSGGIFTVGWLGSPGLGGGMTSSLTLRDPGQISADSSGLCGSDDDDPLNGSFVIGSAPPGTATIRLTMNGLGPVEALLAPTGPRPGERWFATHLPTGCDSQPVEPVVSITAEDAGGAIIATR